MITLYRIINDRLVALHDASIQCIVGESCRMVNMQIDIIEIEKVTIEDKMRSTGRAI